MTFSGGESSGGGLPGVMPDGPAPSAPSTPAAAAPSPGSAVPPGPPATPTPAGAAGAPADDAGVPPTGEPPAGEAPVEGDAQPYTFDGKQYKSQADFENFVRSQNGRVSAQAKQLGEYASVSKAWIEYADSLKAENDRLKAGGSAPPTQGNSSPTTPDQPAAPQGLDGLDWEFYAQLSKEQGPEYAAYWLAQRLDERAEARLNERLDAVEKPRQAEQQAAAQHAKTAAAFDAVATKVDASGQPLYPELMSEDEAVANGVMGIWKSLPRELQLTERGVVLAIGEYRMANGGVPPRPAGAANGASPSPSQVVRDAQATAAQPVSGSGTPRPAPAGPATAEARIRQSIREAGIPRSAGNVSLGFSD